MGCRSESGEDGVDGVIQRIANVRIVCNRAHQRHAAGIARRDAALRQGENNRLDLWDLGSSTGTYLNGVRLVAHRPNRIHDGDEIRLGQMVMRLYFHRPDENALDDGKNGNQASPKNNTKV